MRRSSGFLIVLAIFLCLPFLVGAGSYLYTKSLGKTPEVTGQVTLPFYNFSGGYLKYGHVVVAASKESGTAIVDTVINTAATKLTLVDSLLSEAVAMPLCVYFLNTDNGSCQVWGTDVDGNDTTEILTHATDGDDFTVFRYASLDSIKTPSGAADDTIAVWALPFRGVTTTTGANNANVIGVVTTVDSVADEGVVQVAVAGVVEAYLKNSVYNYPGNAVETTGTAGYGIGVASPTVVQTWGKIVTAYGEDGLVFVHLDLQ